MHVKVIGAGPAGTSAALSALREGAQVSIYEKSKFPRHKVCGEFLSPEVSGLLDELGVWNACEQHKPAILNRVYLSLGKRTKTWHLPAPARGLSRYQMDRILLDSAIAGGATLFRESANPAPGNVLAGGRHLRGSAGDRLFGFKAHFAGATDDVMSLFFLRHAYVGVNAVEGGFTNVCGLASEALLKQYGFEIDVLVRTFKPLQERIQPLTRSMAWLTTGPLVFGAGTGRNDCYSAGDSAAFIDPFTGSGMLGAISVGILAGRAAARGTAPEEYRARWQHVLGKQQLAASIFRSAIESGWAERLLPLVPGAALFRCTRPKRIETGC